MTGDVYPTVEAVKPHVDHVEFHLVG